MFRLTREVRFAINDTPDDQLAGKPTNSFGGFPSLTGFGYFLPIRVSLVTGDLNPQSNYVVNIKQIDEAVRDYMSEVVEMFHSETLTVPKVLYHLHSMLYDLWRERFESVTLALSPFQTMSIYRSECPMVRLSQKFEFSASHRLHNPALSADANVQTYGKCNNPHGHGHNYEVQVTLAGRPDSRGVLVDVPAMERAVNAAVIDRFDHKNLNEELPEFKNLIPTVENIAMTIFQLLKPRFEGAGKLASVTVWETPKTWCEYSE